MISMLDNCLAARPNIEGRWLDILIPVVVIIIYAISGIVKMRSNLKEQQKAEEGTEQPRYRPLDDDTWEEPSGEAAEQESTRLERMLEVKPMAPTRPATRPRQAPTGIQQVPERHERRTLDAFLATQAPKPLAERIAEARAKAEAVAKAQARQQPPQPLWPRAAERMETARMRKPKVPASAVKAAVPPVKPLPPERPAVAPATVWSDLTETDTLRKAVLYAEILGTPVALRDMDV